MIFKNLNFSNLNFRNWTYHRLERYEISNWKISRVFELQKIIWVGKLHYEWFIKRVPKIFQFRIFASLLTVSSIFHKVRYEHPNAEFRGLFWSFSCAESFYLWAIFIEEQIKKCRKFLIVFKFSWTLMNLSFFSRFFLLKRFSNSIPKSPNSYELLYGILLREKNAITIFPSLIRT